VPITINGSAEELPDDPRVSLLDYVREHLQLHGTKKGCDQGACGACTVLADGERILSCLALAVQYEGRSVTTIEGLAGVLPQPTSPDRPPGLPQPTSPDRPPGLPQPTSPDRLPGGVLHPLQRAFIADDGFQCGYCTPGQICSAIGMAQEVRRGVPSHVTADLSAETIELSRDELRERMSGNLCRCGAYNGIVAAIAGTYAMKAAE
jgi:xanthine dehydrogenase YagT iron-sulfur-binding subunit